MKTRFKKFSQCGAALVEYALLLALIYVASVVSLQTLGGGVEKTFAGVNQALTCGGDHGGWGVTGDGKCQAPKPN